MTEIIEHAHWEAFLKDLSKTQHGFEVRMEIISAIPIKVFEHVVYS